MGGIRIGGIRIWLPVPLFSPIVTAGQATALLTPCCDISLLVEAWPMKHGQSLLCSRRSRCLEVLVQLCFEGA